MNKTRHGKIARLPREVREELNRRLENGEPGNKLVAWLNSLPEVQAVMASEFQGIPVREQSLSEWRKGGYRDWQTQREALEVAVRLRESAADWNGDNGMPLSDALALWLGARYAVATRKVADAEGRIDWKLLRKLCRDVVELRKGGSQRGAPAHRERTAGNRKRVETERRVQEKGVDAVLKDPETKRRLVQVRLEGRRSCAENAAGYGMPHPHEPLRGVPGSAPDAPDMP